MPLGWNLTLHDLMARHAGAGRVAWIGLRPERGVPVQVAEQARMTADGLEGDRARAGKRAVTLIQAEHLPVIAELAQLERVAPETLRRNFVVSGINLSTLKGKPLRVGGALLRITTVCAPCSKMEDALGHGGYNAMRGHGGWCAEVLEPGSVARGDAVRPED